MGLLDLFRKKKKIISSFQHDDTGWGIIETKEKKRGFIYRVNYQKMHDICEYMWLHNPLVKRYIELLVSYILGDGITINASDENIARVLNWTWNDFNKSLEDYVRSLFVYGEILLKLDTLKGGKVLVSLIPSKQILSISWDSFYKEPVEAEVMVNGQVTNYSIIHKEKNIADKDVGRYKGDCYYLPVNILVGMERGISDFFAIMDWLEGLDTFLRTALERSTYLLFFLIDVLVKTNDPNEIEKKKKQLTTPLKSGTMVIHNEAEEWKLISPSISAPDITGIARLYKNFILGSLGMPEHWFGEGETVLKATAMEMAEPILRTFQKKQAIVRMMIEKVLDFAIDQAIIQGILTAPDNDQPLYEIVMPSISHKEVSPTVENMVKIANSLAIAQAQGWIDKETAIKIFHYFAGDFTDYDIQKILEEGLF